MVIPFTGVMANLQSKGIDISEQGDALTNALMAVQPNLVGWSYSFSDDILYINLPDVTNISEALTTFGTPNLVGITE